MEDWAAGDTTAGAGEATTAGAVAGRKSAALVAMLPAGGGVARVANAGAGLNWLIVLSSGNDPGGLFA